MAVPLRTSKNQRSLSGDMILASYIKVIRVMRQLCGVGAIFALFALSFVLMLLDLAGVLLIAKLIEEMFEPGSLFGLLSLIFRFLASSCGPLLLDGLTTML